LAGLGEVLGEELAVDLDDDAALALLGGDFTTGNIQKHQQCDTSCNDTGAGIHAVIFEPRRHEGTKENNSRERQAGEH
jgi:hypothetical protein